MKFIIITGPQAVGKMSVGFEIAKQLDLKVFHNHMTIEPIIRLFDFGTPEATYLIRKLREEIFQTMASSSNPGFIFTYVWDFDNPSEERFIRSVFQLFEEQGAECYLLELFSDVEKRLERNNTPLRLIEKPTKRNIEWSQHDLVSSMEKYRLNSFEGELDFKNYMKIDNSLLTVDETANTFINYFNLLQK